MSLSVRSSSTGFSSVRVVKREVRSADHRLFIPLEVTARLPLVLSKARGKFGTLTVNPAAVQGSTARVEVMATFRKSDTGSWSGVVTYVDAAKKEYKIDLEGVRVSDGNAWPDDVVA